jgi:hypothetical protein
MECKKNGYYACVHLGCRRGKVSARTTIRKSKLSAFQNGCRLTHFSRHCETPLFLHYAAVRQEDEEMPYLAQEWLLVRFTKEN